jgi:hypothetical protein
LGKPGKVLRFPVLLLPTLNSVGAEIGKPMAPQTASVGVSTSKFVRNEGEVIRHNFGWCLVLLGYLVVIGVACYLFFQNIAVLPGHRRTQRSFVVLQWGRHAAAIVLRAGGQQRRHALTARRSADDFSRRPFGRLFGSCSSQTSRETMPNQFRRFCFFALLIAAAAANPAGAADSFPFGNELMLDVAPMHGSKRVPMLEIEDDGATTIDLWCTSLHGHTTVNEDSIAIVPGQPGTDPQAQCDPDGQASDAAIVSVLSQVTKWRRNGDLIEFSGAATLRYRLMTN